MRSFSLTPFRKSAPLKGCGKPSFLSQHPKKSDSQQMSIQSLDFSTLGKSINFTPFVHKARNSSPNTVAKLVPTYPPNNTNSPHHSCLSLAHNVKPLHIVYSSSPPLLSPLVASNSTLMHANSWHYAWLNSWLSNSWLLLIETCKAGFLPAILSERALPRSSFFHTNANFFLLYQKLPFEVKLNDRNETYFEF